MTEAFTPKELEFIEAIERYKAAHNKAFLSWPEVLEIVEQLGYRRTDHESAGSRSDEAVSETPLEKSL